MAFVKLDCGILNSTLWVERDPRDLFITSLLMATPCELTEPTEAIKVRTLEPAGFTVPPGWYGFVPAAGQGIVRMAMISDKEEGLTALEALCSPDDESRSNDFEGRRMARIDGGYVILNYMKYREKDNTSAIRSKRYRDRKAMLEAEASRRDSNAVTRDSSRGVTKAEAEAEAEKNNKARVRATTCPEGVSEEVFEQWKAQRRVKKAAVTKIVIDGIRREAGIAGISLEQAMTIQIEMGWQGFKADWLKNVPKQQEAKFV